jgi:hypothetical protein
VVEHLLCKLEALSPNPSPTKNLNKKQAQEREHGQRKTRQVCRHEIQDKVILERRELAGGMAQVVESLPSKCMAPSSIPSTVKKESRAGGMAQLVEHLYSKCEVLSAHLSTTKKSQFEYIWPNYQKSPV